MKNLIYASCFFALIGCNLKEGTENHQCFTDYAEDPVVLAPGADGEWDAGALGSMNILKVGDTYHMYYEAWGSLSDAGTTDEYFSLQIGHATSKDGIKWVKDPENPVIPCGAEGEWDHEGTWDPFVIHEDGIFKMWYGGGVVLRCDCGYATSVDGVHFEKKGQISYLGKIEFEDLHVVHDPDDGKYYLYYWDRAQAPWNDVMDSVPPLPSGLFVASSDDETNYDLDNAIRLKVKDQDWPVKYPHVMKEGNQWIMIFGEAVTRGNPSSTGIATSTDLINWTKRAFPIVKGHDAEILKIGENSWYLYYAPDAYFDMPDCDIRLAVYQGELTDLFDNPKE
jgi:predicted GH43/DUF377 family glycosyl hydrolase